MARSAQGLQGGKERAWKGVCNQKIFFGSSPTPHVLYAIIPLMSSLKQLASYLQRCANLNIMLLTNCCVLSHPHHVNGKSWEDCNMIYYSASHFIKSLTSCLIYYQYKSEHILSSLWTKTMGTPKNSSTLYSPFSLDHQGWLDYLYTIFELLWI